MRRLALALLLTTPWLVACQGGSKKQPEMDEATAQVNDQVVAEVMTWRQERLDGLTRPYGWLSLVGLDWLEEGDNPVGSDAANSVVLPSSVVPRLGVLRLQDGKVHLELTEGETVIVEDEPFSGGELMPDTSAATTVVDLGNVQFHIIERQGRFGVRIKDSEAETARQFQGLDYYDASLRWRAIATVLPYDPPKQIPVPNVLGPPVHEESPAALEFYLDGSIHRLDTLTGSDGGFFLVFGDQTNGQSTYGGGRFLYTEAPDETGKVVVDFNRAYNPPCAFTPFATCPLAPPQNMLPLAIEAGEKNYAGGPH